MRWTQSVGMVPRRRFGPRISEILSGDVDLLSGCRFGKWDETWNFLFCIGLDDKSPLMPGTASH
jgi:hypothetical protein